MYATIAHNNNTRYGENAIKQIHMCNRKQLMGHLPCEQKFAHQRTSVARGCLRYSLPQMS